MWSTSSLEHYLQMVQIGSLAAGSEASACGSWRHILFREERACRAILCGVDGCRKAPSAKLPAQGAEQ